MSLNKEVIENEMLQLMLDSHAKDDTPYTKGIDLGIMFYHWTELNGGPFRDELWDLFWREETWEGIGKYNEKLSEDVVNSEVPANWYDAWNKASDREVTGSSCNYNNNFKKDPVNWDEYWKNYSRVKWSKDVIVMSPDGNVTKVK